MVLPRCCLVARLACVPALCLVAPDTAALAQTGRVNGTVRDDAGKPLRGATVIARNPDATPSSYTATTDDRGRWVVLGLRTGVWTFTVYAAGFITSTGGGHISGIGANPRFDFRLKRGEGSPAPDTPAGPDGDLAPADALLRAGRLEEAVAAYEAIRARKATPAVSLRLGRAYRLRREFDRAIGVLQTVAAKDDPTGECAAETGLALFEKGDLEAAEEVLTRAAGARTAGREVFFALGEVKLARSLTGEATSWYEKAAAVDPSWPRPLLKLGLMAANEGDRETAAKHLNRVLAIAPGSLEARQARTVLDQLR